MADPASFDRWFRRAVIGIPYAWLIVFLLVPSLIVLRIALSQTELAQPPYSPVLDLSAGWQGLKDFFRALSLENFRLLFGDWLYLSSYLRSLTFALVSTLILLVIGIPIAYGMARAPRHLQPVLVMAVILPFWTAFLIRIYAWITILQRDGLLNDALMLFGLVSEPVTWLATDTAILIGIVYSYLPFMVLPLYARLEKLDPALLDAAADLGASPWRAFRAVTLPWAWPGIAAGALLVFVPALGEFVIPELLGGPDTLMIGKVMWNEFFANRDWPLSAAAAVLLLIVLTAPVMAFQAFAARTEPGP
jgi:putrescine transport system permease protein